MNQPQDYDTCSHLKQWIYIKPFSKVEAKAQYDTLRMYIERCAASDSESMKAFVPLDGAVVEYAPDDTTRYDRYREWLISVLYLNTTQPFYFCTCLFSIAGTYQYGRYHPTIAALAVYDYIRKQKQCYSPVLDSLFKRDSQYAFQDGLDPTNLPPLDSLGLGFLLKTGVAYPSPSLSHSYLASFAANPNPFKEVVNLHFELNRTSYVMIEIFDLLGRVVWENKGRTFIEGVHELSVEARSLPEGTLYARIRTGFGEVKTVKLIKE